MKNTSFRKQFILAKSIDTKLFDWESLEIGEFKLFYHPELEVNTFENNLIKLVSLGDLYDFKNVKFSNKQIIEELAQSNQSFDEVLRSSFKYSGTFVLIYYHKQTAEFKLFNDTAAQREVYYIKHDTGGMILGSQPNIINHVYPLAEDEQEGARQFYQSAAFKARRSYVVDSTNYTGLKHLKPNYYLDINKGETIRFFPDQELGTLSLNEGAKKVAEMIRGYVLAANERYPLLIPVSAGWESRVLLAASREILDKCTYFVYKHAYMSDSNQDIAIPKKLFKLLGLPFHIIEYQDEIDQSFLKQVDESVSFPRHAAFKYLYNVLYKQYPEHLCLNGNVSEVGRKEHERVCHITPLKIASLQKYPQEEYAIKRYKIWLEINQPIFEKYHYSVTDMLYWEENCGNWVAKAKTEAMMVSELYSPFNSRALLINLLSVDEKYRGKQNPILYRHITEILWKDVLQVPVNPSLKLRVIGLFQKMGIYVAYRNALLNYKVFKASRKKK